MKITQLKIWLTIFLLTGSLPFVSLGQSDCSESLRKAQRLYFDGHPQLAIKEMGDCLKSGFSRTEKAQALRLVTVIQLMENDPLADETFKNLLRLNPEFKVDTSLNTDPAELVYLYNEFNTNPRFFVRGFVGVNRTSVNELKLFTPGLSGVSKTANQDILPDDFYELHHGKEKDYHPELSFTAGVNIGIPVVHRNFRINTGVSFSQYSYSMESFLLLFDGLLPSKEEEVIESAHFHVTLVENAQVLHIPLHLSLDFDKWSKYNFEKRKVVPFVYGGLGFTQVLGSRYPEMQLENRIASFLSSSEFNDISEQRNSFNLSLTAGAGVKLKIVRKYLVIDFRYDKLLRNYVNPDARYSNPTLLYKFGHVDSDFTFDVMTISLGYEFPFYSHSRKRKTKEFIYHEK